MIRPLTRSADVGSALEKGWNLYKANFWPIFLATFLTLLVSGATCGICAGPMLCGLLGMLLALLRNKDPKPTAGSVFGGFSNFLTSFVTLLVLQMIVFAASMILMVVPILGQIAAAALNWAIGPTVVTMAMFFVVDQGATIGEAIGCSIKLVCEKLFWPIVLVMFVAGLLGGIGMIACGIGLLFTIPLTYCMMVAAYEDVYGEASCEPSAQATEPGALPPAS